MLKRLVCGFCAALILAVPFTSCAKSNSSLVKQASQNTAFLSDFAANGSFKYKSVPWFVSESDFFAKSGIDKKAVVINKETDGFEILYKNKPAYYLPKMSTFSVAFSFTNNKLYKAYCYISFPDQKSFSAGAKALKAILDKNFKKPYIDNTDFLTKLPPKDGTGLGDATWIGKDNSTINFLTFYNKNKVVDGRYLISFQLSAPDNRYSSSSATK